MRRLSRRSTAILATASALFLAVNAGVAWAYWRIGGTGATSATAATVANLQVSGASYPDVPLYPGARGGLAVTVANPNSFPVIVNRVAPGPGPITADAAHQAAGCNQHGVSLADDTFNVSWPIPKNSQQTFVISNSVLMANSSDNACQGATFSIPVSVTATSSTS